MSLASLIRGKSASDKFATATPAISATQPKGEAATVARIATVAVAKADEARVEDTAPPVRATHWLLHFPDREPLESWLAPAVTLDEVLAAEPDAVAAEPLAVRTGTRTATVIERDELLALVGAIYADDTDADKQEAIDAALADPEGALRCYRAIAAERGIHSNHGVLRYDFE